MSNIMKGIAAGFIATIVLPIFMIIKKMMGVMPELDPDTPHNFWCSVRRILCKTN